jgi:hypothetical protein
MEELKQYYSEEQLREALSEMFKVMDFEDVPSIKNKGWKDLKNILKEASKEIYSPEISPDEYDEFSEGTEKLLKDFGYWPGQKEKTLKQRIEEEEEDNEESDEEEQPDLESEIEDAKSLKELKDICKSYDEFKGIRGELSSFKKKTALKNTMLETIGKGVEVEDKDAARAREAVEQKEKEFEKDAKKDKGQSVAAPKNHPKKESKKGSSGQQKSSSEKKEKSKQKIDKKPQKKGNTFADYIDTVLEKGGTWDEIVKECKEEAKRRGYKPPVTKGVINNHIKLRRKSNPDYLNDKKITEDGIK